MSSAQALRDQVAQGTPLVGGRIFARLASVKDGFGNLMLTPEVQAEFGGGGAGRVPAGSRWLVRTDATHIRLAKANRDVLTGALRTTWTLRVDKNAATRSRGSQPRPRRKG